MMPEYTNTVLPKRDGRSFDMNVWDVLTALGLCVDPCFRLLFTIVGIFLNEDLSKQTEKEHA